MQLSELLDPADVLIDLRASDKAQLLREIATRLAGRSGLAGTSIETLLTAREELGSTGVGRGVALPHARAAEAKLSCAVFVRLARPIDFAAVDSRPVDLVCGIVTPDQPRALALTALAAVSRILRDAGVVERLRKARDRQSLFDELVAADMAAPAS